MEITRVQIENFRSIKSALHIHPTSNLPVILIGGNGNGKSNILRAINLFFNDEVEPGLDFDPESDFHQEDNKTRTLITLTLKFSKQHDRAITSHIDKNQQGQFKNYEVTITCTRHSTGTVTYTFIGDRGRKQSYPELMQLIKEYVSCVYIPSNKDHRNILNREMIRKIVAATFQGYGRGIGNARKVKSQKEKFSNLTQDMQSMLDESASYVAELMKGASQRIEDFKFILPHESLEQFLGDLDFQIKEADLSTPIQLGSVGSGIQSFTILTMLRLLHEIRPKSTSKKSAFVWLIEEPETFMHHDLQRKTKEKIFEFAKNGHVFATTHSSIFVDKSNYRSTYSVTRKGGETKVAPISKDTLREVLVGNLGIRFSDINVFGLYNLLVEGETDKAVLTKANEVFKVIDSEDLYIIECGSASGVKHFYEMFSGFNDYAEFVAIFDRDEAGISERDRLLRGGRDKAKLILIPPSTYHDTPGLEELLSEDAWSELITDLYEAELITITSGKGKKKRYDFAHADRIKVKRRSAAFIIEKLTHSPEKCEGFRILLENVRDAFFIPAQKYH